MKKLRIESGKVKNTILVSLATLGLMTGISSCEQLQDSLSSEQNKKVLEDTGSARLSGKNWYYNGLADDDMSLTASKLGDEYFEQSLLVSFGKKVALDSLSGSIEVTYTNGEGNSVTETFPKISGTFTEDYEAFKVDLSSVMALFDTVKIPGGTAVMNLKIGGFKCAEGSQKGRQIASFEAKNIKIQPFFSSDELSFSTVGFSKDTSSLEIPVSGNFVLQNGSSTVTSTASDSKEYSFKVEGRDSAILLSPLFDTPPEDGATLDLLLSGILPEGAGDSYSKGFSVTFTKYKIVIDGVKDGNFAEENGALYLSDPASDQWEYGSTGYDVSAQTDLSGLSVTSDDDYLYIGVSGSLQLTWANPLGILVSNGSVTGGSGARSSVSIADAEDFANKGGRSAKVQPNVYISHQPGANNDGNGALSAFAWISSTNTDITSSVKCAPKGWNEETVSSFLEYAIPLGSVSGLNKGDTVSIIVAAGLGWDEGFAVVDACPDSAVSKNPDSMSVKYDFANGMSYKIPD
ncbi:MAG: hypothetical protein IJ257_04130 [Treponema sp.]|nr:hypothetical protein [Treponema sp.]